MKETNDNVLFRKAGKGYNKEDVNAYILNLSAQITDKDASISYLEEKNKEMSAQILELEAKLKESEEKIQKLTEEKDLSIAENKVLAKKIVEMNGEQKKVYDDYCEKAGEIIAIATETATKIVTDAAKKSDSDDVEAVLDECEKKINESVDSVIAMKDVPEEDKPKVDF